VQQIIQIQILNKIILVTGAKVIRFFNKRPPKCGLKRENENTLNSRGFSELDTAASPLGLQMTCTAVQMPC